MDPDRIKKLHTHFVSPGHAHFKTKKHTALLRFTKIVKIIEKFCARDYLA